MNLPTQKLDLCAANYDRLTQLCGDLTDLPEAAKSQTAGFMDLCFDRLYEQPGATRIALAHYYSSHGDLVADPDMEIVIHTTAALAEAVRFQNAWLYHQGYAEDGRPTPAWGGMNAFLGEWLANLIEQGHSLREAQHA